MLSYFNQKRRNSVMERETICKNRKNLKSLMSLKVSKNIFFPSYSQYIVSFRLKKFWKLIFVLKKTVLLQHGL
jgi:hypothetical protein